MTESKLSKFEGTKAESHQLRGTIAEELKNDAADFTDDAMQLLKTHGTYLQDNRDARGAKDAEGKPLGKQYMMMVRTRVPGGKVSAKQFLAELDLCDDYGNGTLRVTTRQGFQLHGVLKKNLKETIRTINQIQLSTFCACGDVERNVMCCPAPYKNHKIHEQMQAMTDALAEHLKPKTTAYYEIWLTDEDGQKTDVTEFKPVDEPIYGKAYLPRKFKTGVGLPHDNCIDVYDQDLGFLAVIENDEIIGYNVLVGGSMGMTPARKDTFPALAKRMAFITPDQAIGVAEAVVKVQRDFGNREDRKLARMKYLVANWGVPKFKAKVEEYYGQPLADPHPTDVTGVDDHIGWHEQGDGNWFLGVNVENGRIKDEGNLRLKSFFRAVLGKYGMNTRLTALQGVILCDIRPEQRADISAMMREHGVKSAEELTLARRYSIACPAYPTCGLAVTESERVMPDIMDAIEAELDKYGLLGERISVHMTGCPNGCARPYTPEIGLVGKGKHMYTLYLGGAIEGHRMAFLYKDKVMQDDIAPILSPLFAYYKTTRTNGESFGDFCHRVGVEDLLAHGER